MALFAVRYVEAIAEGALPIRLATIAEQAGVSAQTVSEWRNQTPGFNEWLAAQLQAYVGHTWPAIKAVAVRFAMRGSIAHMNFIRDLMEPGKGGGDASPAPGAAVGLFAGAVIVNLPQPPAELEGHPVIRGLLDGAQTIEAFATPSGP